MIPKSLKRYKVIEWIGGGRFGDVYLVEDTLIKKKFAMKVGRGGGNINAFLDEAKILASLDHPNIVRFYTADIIKNRIIIITEFIKGESLRDIIEKRAPISKDEALFITADILKALSYAHKYGVIHRDLKPENIIISDKGEVKVVDFGIARIGEGDMTLSIAGTPPYMPKEAWKGKADERSDIWAVGVILYEMLTGVNPFNGDNIESVRKNIFSGKVASVKELNPDISTEVDKIVKKALEPAPSKRY